MEHKFEIAVRMLQVSFDLFYRMRMDARWGPIGKNMYTHCGESSESLEDDCGGDRVQWCCFLTSFQEGPHQKWFVQEKNSKF